MTKNFKWYTIASHTSTLTGIGNQAAAGTPYNTTFADMNIQGRIFDNLIDSYIPYINVHIQFNQPSYDSFSHGGYLAWFPEKYFSSPSSPQKIPTMTFLDYPKNLIFASLDNPAIGSANPLYSALHIKVPYCCGVNSHIVHLFDYDTNGVTDVEMTVDNLVWTLQ